MTLPHTQSVPAHMSPATEPVPRWWPWVRAALFLTGLGLIGLLVLPTVLGRPTYEVQGGQLIAQAFQARTVIPAGTPVTQERIVIRRKVVGSAMTGYTVGRFELARHGLADLYTDGSERALVFRTSPRVTVLTPADPDALLRAWRTETNSMFRPARPAHFTAWTALPLLATLPLLVIGARRPRMEYCWEDGALVVRTSMSSQRFLIGATKAELTREGLGLRLFGTAIPGYYTGTFSTKSAGGGRVQAYATTSKPKEALLLRLDGTTYYLTPEHPHRALERFSTG
ncbi:hypothetical protein GCM10008955_32950 [Deinococcus malanensis]|uniref:Bacterial Pleckstrin homology domain-containing protein n=1 Tax=Deinococcus malanensis TaxID=1706855 RepID=A0ABQ2EZQ5_9DEIO|nr:PH domain-containing protein [Deinococcus malanensis]GGK36535.1 hypothetical protein GCM10008955_32950 [Deinococcus malanensis]